MVNKTLQQVPNNKPVAIIIRHAERDEIPSMMQAMDPLLTKQGKDDSYQLGIQLSSFSTYNLFHSPVPRCKETAEHIQKGLQTLNNDSTVKGEIFDLGGPYVKGDWLDLVKLVDSMGHDTFLRQWFDGNIADNLVMPLNTAAFSQLRVLSNQLQDSDISTINVTHDWNIAIMREYFFNLKHEEINMPDYLDGLVAYNAGDSIQLLYNNKQIKIPYKDFPV